jgi:hypothetical protein
MTVMRAALLACVMVGCTGGAAPDIIGLTDQIAVVGQELVLQIEGVDPDGDSLSYRVKADLPLEGVATMSQTPAGIGIFRWTPLATDVGPHVFDFTVSDGKKSTTVSINIEVRASAGGVPIFRQPLGSGRVFNLSSMNPCVLVDIVVEDEDTAQVTIGEEEPAIPGAMLTQLSGTTATWRWCPTSQQVAASDRYTLILSADDETHHVTKEYVLVLGGSGGGGTAPGLIINEVDYDNVGADTAELIELYNASGKVLPLTGLKVMLVNGATNTVYQTIDLGSGGQLAIGQYLVIAGSSVTVPTSAKKIDPLWTQDQIQNGAPDGIVVIDDVTKTVLDALSYEGAITAATLPGFASPVSLVEGTALDAAIADSNTQTMSLCRIPSGKDTNNAAVDWKTCGTLTVGRANTQ